MRTSGEILLADFARPGMPERSVSPRVQSHWQLDRDGKLLLRWYLDSAKPWGHAGATLTEAPSLTGEHDHGGLYGFHRILFCRKYPVAVDGALRRNVPDPPTQI
jgi:hypothetical protein